MKSEAYYIGVDLAKQSSYFVIQDSQGEIKKKAKVANDPSAIKKCLEPFLRGSCSAVIEACCNYYWMYQQLSNLGCKVILAHPLKTKAIAAAKIKNGRLDATMLCTLLRADLIPQSYVPSPKIRELRELVRQHIRLVQIRTKIKNQFQALLTKLNLQCADSPSDTFGKKGREWLRKTNFEGVFDFQKQQYLDQIEYYNQLINRTDQRIRLTLPDYPESQRLMDIPGVGVLSAAILTAEIGDISRFTSSKQLVGYAGLAPGLYESGNTSHARGITHQGNRFLRWIVCEIAHQHIRKTGPLRDFYLRLKEKKGHGKAIVATGRKLLTLVFYVLKGKNLTLTTQIG